MKSRAAILPFPGDPFLLNYWLKFFQNYWGKEVDKLYIYFNSPIESSVVEYIQLLCSRDPAITLLYHPNQIEHGDAINKTLDVVQEELLLLIEDDGFIFKSGYVDKYFQDIESGKYDIVGSRRGSCSMEILERSRALYGLDYEGEGDQGCNFWPNFFFCRKELLLQTDRRFGARAWQAGEQVIPLSRPGNPFFVKELSPADTFVNTSMQLLTLVPQERIQYVPQYHGSPDDLEHHDRHYNLFDGIAYWVHVGSLSSGVGGILQDGYGRSLARRLIDEPKENGELPNYCNTEQEKNEWERRVQWWLTFWQMREPVFINEFAELYEQAINRLISQYQLSRTRIERRQRIYHYIGL